jgi:hypothetical protein
VERGDVLCADPVDDTVLLLAMLPPLTDVLVAPEVEELSEYELEVARPVLDAAPLSDADLDSELDVAPVSVAELRPELDAVPMSVAEMARDVF